MKYLLETPINYIKSDRLFGYLTMITILGYALLWFFWRQKIGTDAFTFLFLTSAVVSNILLAFVAASREFFISYVLLSTAIFLEFLFTVLLYTT